MDKSMNYFRCVVLCFGASLLGACTNIKDKIVEAPLNVCNESGCYNATEMTSIDSLFDGLQELIKQNAELPVLMCSSDPKTRQCKSTKVCHFVLGGVLPGNGCSNSLIFSGVELGDAGADPTMMIMKADMPLTFIGTPLKCRTAEAVLTLSASQTISLELKPHFCNWMVVGNMSAHLLFSVESIDFERGEVGGYWAHSVSGTGNGAGSGYLLLNFPNKGIGSEISMREE
jgi:hypothetical protein